MRNKWISACEALKTMPGAAIITLPLETPQSFAFWWHQTTAFPQRNLFQAFAHMIPKVSG